MSVFGRGVPHEKHKGLSHTRVTNEEVSRVILLYRGRRRDLEVDVMGRTSTEYLRKRFESSRQRLLANAPLLAQASESGVGSAMNAGEIGALESVGLSVAPWEEGADPLILSIRDYMALLETSYTTSEAAKILQVDASRIRQRLRERSLYGVDYEGRKRLPRFQFEGGRPIPGLKEVLVGVPTDLSPLDLATWFLSANPDLEIEDKELSPRQWLLSGQEVAVVVRLARGLEPGIG